MNIPDFSIEDTDHYPPCLRRTDKAGDAFKRSDETIERYRYRCELLSRQAHQFYRADEPLELHQFIDYVVAHGRDLSRNTRMQYRAACLQAIRDEFDLRWVDEQEAADLVDVLDDYLMGCGETDVGSDKHQPAAKRSAPRTSAGRTRYILPVEKDNIHSQLAPNDPYDYALQMINEYGDRVGLRLIEWLTASVHGSNLVVISAKFTEDGKKGLSEFRELPLATGFSAEEIEELEIRLDGLRSLVRDEGTKKVCLRLYARFRAVADIACPKRKLTIRTYRDQFRANAEADGWAPEQIGAAMGQSSADSRLSYGVTRRGRRGSRLAMFDSTLVQHVRPGANTYSRRKRNARNRELKLWVRNLGTGSSADTYEHVPTYTPFG